MDPKNNKAYFQPLQQFFISCEILLTTILGAIRFNWDPSGANEESDVRALTATDPTTTHPEEEVDSDASTGTVIIHDTDEEAHDRDTVGDID